MAKLKKEDKQILLVILIGIIIIGSFFAVYYIKKSAETIDYKGMKFRMIKKSDGITTYQYRIPLIVKGERVDYMFYLRNNPWELEKINLSANISLLDYILLKSEGDLTCGGDGFIAAGNLGNALIIDGKKLLVNKSLPCESPTKYSCIIIKESNQTRIAEVRKNVYEIDVANCEVLKAVERFTLEILKDIHSKTLE